MKVDWGWACDGERRHDPKAEQKLNVQELKEKTAEHQLVPISHNGN